MFWAAALLLVASPQGGSAIEVWTDGDDGRPIDLTTLPTEERELEDMQYGRRIRFRVMPMSDLIERSKPPASVNLALIRFHNGMSIPYRFRDTRRVREHPTFVAVALSEGGRWTSEFPEISRTSKYHADSRPLRFRGNKIVVESGWHEMVPKEHSRGFSPWRTADSVSGIELVNEQAYLQQFRAGRDVERGFRRFVQSCQFCHGVRGVGATYGWDFVDPIPVLEYHGTVTSLHYHISYRASDAASRGILMPALKHLDEDDARDLFQWLRAISGKRQLLHKPSR